MKEVPLGASVSQDSINEGDESMLVTTEVERKKLAYNT